MKQFIEVANGTHCVRTYHMYSCFNEYTLTTRLGEVASKDLGFSFENQKLKDV